MISCTKYFSGNILAGIDIFFLVNRFSYTRCSINWLTEKRQQWIEVTIPLFTFLIRFFGVATTLSGFSSIVDCMKGWFFGTLMKKSERVPSVRADASEQPQQPASPSCTSFDSQKKITEKNFECEEYKNEHTEL